MACAACTDPAMMSAPSPSGTDPGPADGGFNLDAAWRLHPHVAVRPERFGALLYHFRTRRLSFLKDRTLLAVVRSLADQPSARTACQAAGVRPAELARYETALATLAASHMITARPSPRSEERQSKEAP
ncbi:mycofactocin biosynthesis chaperone MftB [Streptomyces malaysiensis]|uniref:mycofactocin biosynthesis chaperone MftB n=1 Tax=Streptomyces malaysiensis TaxID=92644 RepID=UPI0028C42FBA|nr:mycofactocin biosynthesis chaperone MftB [Streptomyces malaysiensis]